MARQRSIAGKVVAITGGARGIGLATAVILKGVGAKVAIGDIDADGAAQTAARHGLDAHAPVNVTDRQSFTAFLDAVEQALGPIDVLVNNAGVIAVGDVVDEADDVTRRVLDVNVFGVILGTKLALQRMLPRGAGHIINVASMGSLMAVPSIATYCATKYAVLGFTEAVRQEHRGDGVRFSTVHPTLTNTAMIDGTQGARGLRNAEPEEVGEAIASLIAKPRRRAMVPAQIGPMLWVQRLLPQTFGETLSRLLKADAVFAKADHSQRADYAKRTGTS